MDNNNPFFPNNDPPVHGAGEIKRQIKENVDEVREKKKETEGGSDDSVQQTTNKSVMGRKEPDQFQNNTQNADERPNFTAPDVTQPNLSGGQDNDGQGLKKKFPIKIILTIIIVIIALSLIGVFLVRFLKQGIPQFGKKGEIVWWGTTYDEQVVNPLIEEFEKNNSGITIDYIKQSPKDYRERLTNALARGEGPDIFEFHNSWTPMFRNNFSTMPSGVMSSAEYAQTFYPVAVADFATEEGVVAVPLYYDALTLFINEDIFAASGATPPVDWNDFRETAISLTQKPDDIIIQAGAALGTTSNVDYWPETIGLMLHQNKFDRLNPNGPKVEDALVFYSIFSSLHGVWDETLPPSIQAFANGKAAMIFAPSSVAAEINRINPELRFRTINVPKVPLNDPSEPDVSYATYWAHGVWEKSVNKQKSWELLQYLSSQDSLKRLRSNYLQTSNFALAYPRRDMAALLREDPILGSVINLAPNAKSWYLAYETNDGAGGINTKINTVFDTALVGIRKGTPATKIVESLASDVRQVLAEYGLVRIQPSPTQ